MNTIGMPRPEKPVLTPDQQFLIDVANGWIAWEALLDQAEADLIQCND